MNRLGTAVTTKRQGNSSLNQRSKQHTTNLSDLADGRTISQRSLSPAQTYVTVLLDVSLNVGPLLSHHLKGPIRETDLLQSGGTRI